MTNSFLSAIGDGIRALRVSAGMTQAELAIAADLHPKFVSRMELGLQNVTVTSLARVAMAFDVPVSSLLDGIAADPVALAVKPRVNARKLPAAAKPG